MTEQTNEHAAPRVTLADVEAAIVGETYTVLPNGRTTVCQLTLDNGFTVEGMSACVSIENFNAELGNKYSRQRAVDEVWQLLGFRLADQLAAEGHNQTDVPPHVFRMQAERAQLNTRIESLCGFMATDRAAALTENERQRMWAQAKAMTAYLNLLTQRIEVATAGATN